MRQLDYYEPTNRLRWWQSALLAVALATGAGILFGWMYRSRGQDVPNDYVIALGLVAWVSFSLISGVDLRLSAKLRGALSLLGGCIGLLVAAAAGLGVLLY